ncbi:MAG: hypothetical protein NTY09_00290, partial [bacterium]|nr:hypothetical protein [bacterium]
SHEVSHSLSRDSGQIGRLIGYYNIINELNCTAMGISFCKSLYERGFIKKKPVSGEPKTGV